MSFWAKSIRSNWINVIKLLISILNQNSCNSKQFIIPLHCWSGRVHPSIYLLISRSCSMSNKLEKAFSSRYWSSSHSGTVWTRLRQQKGNEVCLRATCCAMTRLLSASPAQCCRPALSQPICRLRRYHVSAAEIRKSSARENTQTG